MTSESPDRAGRRDPFALLGLPATFEVDTALLEARYLALQRRTHPDGFTRATPAERLQSLEAAASVNEAYALLKDPFRRAAHLVQATTPGRRAVSSPELLDEVMEVQEFVAEAKGAGDRERLESVRRDLKARLKALEGRLAELFRTDGAAHAAEIDEAVTAARYWKSVLDEIRDQKR